MVAVTEPETVVRLDTPAGLVVARVAVSEGKATAVTLRNVPSFLHAADRELDVPGLGTIRYDMAFGGNFYAITPASDAGLARGFAVAVAVGIGASREAIWTSSSRASSFSWSITPTSNRRPSAKRTHVSPGASLFKAAPRGVRAKRSPLS